MAGGIRPEADEDGIGELSEINVTPFIDVMLVLLIIFMVAAPLATVDIAVDLPTSTATPAPKPDKPVYVTVQSDLSVRVGEAAVGPAELPAALALATGGDAEARIFLRADRSVAYGDVMTVMNRLRDSGHPKIALVGLESVPNAAPATP